MPFGAMYGALFFAVMALWLALSPGSLPDVGFAPRTFLVAAAAAAGLGLLLRQPWARWGGAALALVVGVWMARAFLAAPGPAPVLFLVGSLTGAALLLLPVTGRAGAPPSAVALGRAAGWVAAVGSLGFVASSLWPGVAPNVTTAKPRPATRAAASAELPDRVRWTDFGSGLERAADEDKPLVVTFVANWCGYCQKMDRTTWKDPRVIEKLADVVPVRVDVDETAARNGYSGADLATRYGIRGTPCLLLLDGEGRALARADGYKDASDTLAWLDGARGRVGAARNSQAANTETH